MEILDAHSHFFSRVFFETLASLSPLAGSVDEKLVGLSERTGVHVPVEAPPDHAARWLRAMDEAGVRRMVSFASVPEEAAAVAEGVAATAGRLVGFTVVNPLAPTAKDFVTRALGALGHRGLVLFPAMHGYAVSDPRVRPVLEIAREHGAIVVVHCGLLHIALRDLLGIPKAYAPRLSDPLELVPVAQSLPSVRFVIPHFGAGFLHETLMACAMAPNVLVDTSSSNSWTAMHVELEQVVQRFLRVIGPERILYGSDSSTFPRGYRSDLLHRQREIFEALLPDRAHREAILGGNLAHLLELA